MIYSAIASSVYEPRSPSGPIFQIERAPYRANTIFLISFGLLSHAPKSIVISYVFIGTKYIYTNTIAEKFNLNFNIPQNVQVRNMRRH